MTTESHNYPTPAQYWKIAAILGVVTGTEIALFYIDRALDLGVLNTPMLLALSGVKFLVVVGWFMHVRYEKPLIGRFFTGGFVLAGILYMVVLVALGTALAS